MQVRLIEFVDLLRRGGVRVSTAEVVDAAEALTAVSLEERSGVRAALRATLVKRNSDRNIFEELFDLYWSSFQGALHEAFQAAPFSEDGAALEALLRQLQPAEGPRPLSAIPPLSELARALWDADLGALEAAIRAAGERAGVGRIESFLQVGFFTRLLMEQLGAAETGRELLAAAVALRRAGLGDAEAEALAAFVQERLEALRRSVRSYVERQLQQRQRDAVAQFRRRALLERSFYTLTEEDVRELRGAVAQLAERIRNALSLRRKREKRGRLDLHHTLRKNLSHGGVPFELAFKRRVRDRPKVVILCDVSSSVANVSRFMLQFAYSLQDAFTKIRSFVFVADIGEVTPLFQRDEINAAIERALEGGDVINPYTRSDFGAAFYQFWREYLAAVDKRTTVIVLGDARNNYNDPRAWCLEEIRSKAKNVLWLNPENPAAWGFGDSAMDRYRPFCDRAVECRNVKQLAEFVDELLL